jgi:opacity protein-like surface antigen
MRHLLLIAMTMIGLSTAHAQNTFVYTGIGQERMYSPRSVTGNLIEAGVLHRFNSGITVGALTQNIYPNQNLPTMNLTAALVGYSTRINQFSPYTLIGAGNRSTNGTNANYYQISIGTKYNFNSNWFSDVQYRYRNSDEISGFRTNRYLVGGGYNFTKNISGLVNYAVVQGDIKSNQLFAGVAYKF